MAHLELPQHFFREYTENEELLLQEMFSRYVNNSVVQQRSYSGEAAQAIKQFGDVEFRERNVRHQDTEFSDILHEQVWIFPTDYSLALAIDSEDELRLLNSPQSSYSQAMAAAWNRNQNATVFSAFFADARTGKNGASITPFDNANFTVPATYVGAGAAGTTGLTVAKLQHAKALMGQAHALDTGEEIYVSVSYDDLEVMLSQLEPASADYNEVRALRDGSISKFAGINFIMDPDVVTLGLNTTTGFRELPVWVPSGMIYGLWNQKIIDIDLRPDKQNLIQLLGKGTNAATRTQNGKVVKIEVSPGAFGGTPIAA